MSDLIVGKAVCLRGDDINTDVLYPGAFLTVSKPAEMAKHLFEGIDPALRGELEGPTVLCVDNNFGCGSSREHVPHAIRENGIVCVLGRSFARIFYRNCFNLGVPAIVCPDASSAAQPGSTVEVNAAKGLVSVDGARFESTPIAPFVLDMLEHGGLIHWTRAQLAGAELLIPRDA